MKIKQIIVEIWTHLFLRISLKIAKLRYIHYYYFCILGDVALNYHVDIWTRLLIKLLTGGQKLAGELVVGRNYRKTLFALRIHTPNA